MNVKQIIMVTYTAIIHNIPFQVNTSTLISEVHILNNNSGMTITTIIGNRITVISFGIQSQLYRMHFDSIIHERSHTIPSYRWMLLVNSV